MREISTSQDLGLPDVASWLNGYSVADITYVGRDAAMMIMRRRIAGQKPSEVILGREGLALPLPMEDFKEAVEKCNKGVSSKDRKHGGRSQDQLKRAKESSGIIL